MTINTLLEAGPQFNLKGLKKVKLIGQNFEQAKKLLNITDKKDIERLKAKDASLIKTERGEDLLTAIHIMAKVGHKMGSKYGEDKVTFANEILGKLETGFPDDKKGISSDPLYKESKKAFNDKYERHNPGVENVRDKKVADDQSQEIAQKKEEPAAPATEIAQKKEPADVAGAEEEPEVKDDDDVKVSSSQSVDDLEDLRAATVKEIQRKVNTLAKDTSIAGKAKHAKTDGILKKYQKDMGKLIEKFKLGPAHASPVSNKADSISRIASNEAIRAGLKGAIGRTIQKGGEIASSMKGAVVKAGEKADKALRNPQLQRAVKTGKEVAGNIKDKTEEKLGKFDVKNQEREIAREKAKESGTTTTPIKDAISKVKTKTASSIGKAKEATNKVLDKGKGVFKKKEKPSVMPKEGIIKPSTQEELSPTEEKKKRDAMTLKRLTNKAKVAAARKKTNTRYIS
jgi:hypothetical protein